MDAHMKERTFQVQNEYSHCLLFDNVQLHAVCVQDLVALNVMEFCLI